jgi:hypothetical protein
MTVFRYVKGEILWVLKIVSLGMMILVCNPRTWDAEVEGSQDLGQPGLHS